MVAIVLQLSRPYILKKNHGKILSAISTMQEKTNFIYNDSSSMLSWFNIEPTKTIVLTEQTWHW